jgi:hypothetical protein
MRIGRNPFRHLGSAPSGGAAEDEESEAMGFLLVVVMIGVLLAALVLSKGRNFFKYAEMSRTLPYEDNKSVLKGQSRRVAR